MAPSITRRTQMATVAMKTGLVTAIIFAAMLYVVAMFGAFMLRDGKEVA